MTVNVLEPHLAEPVDERPVQVVLSDVSKVYRPRGGEPVPALADVSLAVRQGEIFGIIGRSGAGKSSLIRLINGLEAPTGGSVLVEGTDVAALDEAGLTGLRRSIGMIFQGFNLLAARTVLDNVALPLRFAGVGRSEARRRALDALDLVGLSDKAGAYPGRLSGGQKQRAGIARAIVQKPKLLLSDEATSALDPETTRSILALLKDVNRRLGITIVLITHEMEVIRDIADRVAVIEAGRIVETGPTWRIFGSPRHPATRALLHRSDTPSDPDPGTGQEDVVYALAFGGAEPSEPNLAELAAIVGPEARLVGADLGRIQGRLQGTLRVAVRRGGADPATVLARLRTLVPHAEIAGRAD